MFYIAIRLCLLFSWYQYVAAGAGSNSFMEVSITASELEFLHSECANSISSSAIPEARRPRPSGFCAVLCSQNSLCGGFEIHEEANNCTFYGKVFNTGCQTKAVTAPVFVKDFKNEGSDINIAFNKPIKGNTYIYLNNQPNQTVVSACSACSANKPYCWVGYGSSSDSDSGLRVDLEDEYEVSKIAITTSKYLGFRKMIIHVGNTGLVASDPLFYELLASESKHYERFVFNRMEKPVRGRYISVTGTSTYISFCFLEAYGNKVH